MRSLWNGHISFGLVTIPVKLKSATAGEELSFRFLRKSDLSPINYERIAEKDGQEVPWEDVVKGYEVEKGKYVVLTEEDFKRADVEATRTIDIVDFVDADQVDMMYFDKPYYLEPGKGGEKPYALLRDALAATGRVGIAKVVIRTRQHLAAIAPKGRALVLNVMRFQDELVDPAGLDLPGEAGVDKRELEMAKKLIENLAEPFDPARYTDDYREELLRVIHEKAAGREPRPAGKASSPQVIDIMSALKASLERTRRAPARKAVGAGRGGSRRASERAADGSRSPARRRGARGQTGARKAG
ncbi:MAG TPA: Ku protein [Gemmatimonadota bacterium]|jgi:DNA end-binding protein Ku